jgi:hypothetical protein
MKHINTRIPCGQNTDFLNVKIYDIFYIHCALKGNDTSFTLKNLQCTITLHPQAMG